MAEWPQLRGGCGVVICRYSLVRPELHLSYSESLMAFLFLGVTKGYQYLAISIAYSIIAVASVLIVKSKRIEKKLSISDVVYNIKYK